MANDDDLLALGDGGPALVSKLLLESIDQHARVRPSATAVESGDRVLTYGELVRRSRRLAGKLQALGATKGRHVVVHGLPDVDWFVAVLGILRAGAAYVPIEPRLPEERVSHILSAVAPVAIVHSDRFVPAFSGAPTLLRIDESADEVPFAEVTIGDDDSAYVLFTSGSTGVPKGVVIGHRSLAHQLEVSRRLFDVGDDARVAQFHPPGFDGTVLEAFLPLIAGGAVVCAVDRERVPGPELEKFLVDRRITFVLAVPAFVELLQSTDFPSLRTLVLGGDVLTAEVVARWVQKFRCFNLYGPTEATIYSTSDVCVPGERPTLGRPTAGARIYVVDPDGNLVPRGESGEIWIAGATVGKGYLDASETDRARFRDDPFVSGARLYRTGDRGRWNESGDLEFLGRMDRQVKIRGYRIELGEIEDVLVRQPGVRLGCVVVVGDDAEKELVAFVSSDSPLRGADLAEGLARELPEHMVPTDWVIRSSLPRTANGKVDTKALSLERQKTTAKLLPKDPLVAVRASVLDIFGGQVGDEDDLHAIGVTSIAFARLVARLREGWPQLRIIDAYSHPTIAKLGALVGTLERSSGAAAPPPVERTFLDADRDHVLPMTEALRFHFLRWQANEGRPVGMSAGRVTVAGVIDEAEAAAAWHRVVEANAALRCVFQVDGTTLSTSVRSAAKRRFRCVDAGDLPLEHEEIMVRSEEEQALRLDATKDVPELVVIRRRSSTTLILGCADAFCDYQSFFNVWAAFFRALDREVLAPSAPFAQGRPEDLARAELFLRRMQPADAEPAIAPIPSVGALLDDRRALGDLVGTYARFFTRALPRIKPFLPPKSNEQKGSTPPFAAVARALIVSRGAHAVRHLSADLTRGVVRAAAATASSPHSLCLAAYGSALLDWLKKDRIHVAVTTNSRSDGELGAIGRYIKMYPFVIERAASPRAELERVNADLLELLDTRFAPEVRSFVFSEFLYNGITETAPDHFGQRAVSDAVMSQTAPSTNGLLCILSNRIVLDLLYDPRMLIGGTADRLLADMDRKLTHLVAEVHGGIAS